jgi:hypothetical protein
MSDTAENDAGREPGEYVKCSTGTQVWCTHLRCGYVPWDEVYPHDADTCRYPENHWQPSVIPPGKREEG